MHKKPEGVSCRMQRAAAMRAYEGFIDMLTQPEPDCVWIVPGTLEREGED